METSLTTSFTHARGRYPGSVFGPGVVGRVAILGSVTAGAAVVEAALIPGLLIGGAAVLAPRLLPRDMLSGLRDRLRRTAPSPKMPVSPPPAHSAKGPASGEPASFDTWHAVVKTFTYRVMVTTVDFGANYFVIGELATAAVLSTLSLVGGPIAYFTHEAAWHYFGPASARHPNPLRATVRVSIPGVAGGEENGRTRFASVEVSRALAKTVTYEAVTAVSEFGANYFFIRDLAAAAGLTAFSIVIAPLVYYVHEKAWDYYDATKARSPAAPALRLGYFRRLSRDSAGATWNATAIFHDGVWAGMLRLVVLAPVAVFASHGDTITPQPDSPTSVHRRRRSYSRGGQFVLHPKAHCRRRCALDDRRHFHVAVYG
jgi:uncharacterized membrane protein